MYILSKFDTVTPKVVLWNFIYLEDTKVANNFCGVRSCNLLVLLAVLVSCNIMTCITESTVNGD